MSEFNKMMNKRAVALQYDEDKNVAPVIVASGSGLLAEKIIEVANENEIPVYEDNSLASVLSKLELGSFIPPELYAAIVDIYVFFLNYAPGTKEKKKANTQEEAMRRQAEAHEAARKAKEAEAEVDEEEKYWGNDGITGSDNNYDYNRAMKGEETTEEETTGNEKFRNFNPESANSDMEDRLSDIHSALNDFAEPWTPKKFS